MAHSGHVSAGRAVSWREKATTLKIVRQFDRKQYYYRNGSENATQANIRPRQVWTSRAALVIQVPRLLARTIGRDLVGPVEQLGVDAVADNQPLNTILARASALVTSDAQHSQLADDVAEDDGAIAGHHNHPSTRKARSICAVAISMSDLFLVCAAFGNSSAAKSQCGRAWRATMIGQSS